MIILQDMNISDLEAILQVNLSQMKQSQYIYVI